MLLAKRDECALNGNFYPANSILVGSLQLAFFRRDELSVGQLGPFVVKPQRHAQTEVPASRSYSK